MSNDNGRPGQPDPGRPGDGSWLDPDFAQGQGDYYGRYGVPTDGGRDRGADPAAAGRREQVGRRPVPPDQPPRHGVPQDRGPQSAGPGRPGPGQPGPGAGSRRWWPWAALVVALVLAGGALAFALRDPDGVTYGPSPGGAPASATTTGAARSSTSAATSTATVPAVIDGWEAYPSPRFDDDAPRAVFDVPPESVTFPKQGGGTVQAFSRPDEFTLVGFTAGTTTVAAQGPSQFALGACAADPKQSGGMIGWVKTSSDPVVAVGNVTDRFVEAMGTRESGQKVSSTKGDAQNTTVNQGRTPAAQTRSTIPQSKKNVCGDIDRELVVTSFATPRGPVTAVLVRLKSGPLEMDDNTMNQVLSSLRPMP